jgi:glutathione synthase/RimK-type ligase-like ATP-grasp enzyme
VTQEPSILIFSSMGEPCTQWVTRELDKSGSAYVLINFEDALINSQWSISIDMEHEAVLRLSKRGSDGSLCRPSSVWMRRWGYPAFPSSFDDYSTAFAFNEISAVVASLPDVLESAKWINNQANERSASNKIAQLNLARRLGFLIPPTLVTTDEAKVREFLRQVGRVIFKPVSAFQPQFRKFNAPANAKLSSNPDGIKLGFGSKTESLIVFTQELTPDKLDLLETIRWSPTIFQKRIDKKADIRVTVVGNRLFSCRIDSQSHPETETDFRMMNISGLLPHAIVDLPAKLENDILLLMRNLGLSFGCLDFIQTIDDDFYFLEVNPAGQWLWIEQVTGAQISSAIADELRLPIEL